MNVTLVRHGSAEDRARRDRERALTLAGRAEVKSLGEHLRAAIDVPELVVSSPYVRAVQTAELLAATLDYAGAIRIEHRLRPDCSAEELAKLLATGWGGDGVVRSRAAPAAPADLPGVAHLHPLTLVALVAHEPILSALAQLLLGRPVSGLQRAEALCLSWEPPSLGRAQLLCRILPSPVSG